MKKYKMLALDIDGTILNDQKNITDNTKKWIIKAIDTGIIVVFSTGRGMQTVYEILEELKISTPLVLVNGSDIRVDPNKILCRKFLKNKDIKLLHYIANKYETQFWGYNTEGKIYINDWNNTVLKNNWLKFGIKHEDILLIDRIREELKKHNRWEIARSAPNNIEISPIGITKSKGVQKLCEHFEVKIDEVMAVGDSYNDFHLIKDAGMGIAMGNAEKVVKEIADYHTNDNNNEGVSNVIKNILLNC